MEGCYSQGVGAATAMRCRTLLYYGHCRTTDTVILWTLSYYGHCRTLSYYKHYHTMDTVVLRTLSYYGHCRTTDTVVLARTLDPEGIGCTQRVLQV